MIQAKLQQQKKVLLHIDLLTEFIVSEMCMYVYFVHLGSVLNAAISCDWCIPPVAASAVEGGRPPAPALPLPINTAAQNTTYNNL